MKSASYLAVAVVFLSNVSCQSTWLQGNDIQDGRAPFQATDEVQHRRKLLQSGTVQVVLELGLLESSCNQTEGFGATSFVDEWNEAMRCTRCSSIYDISECDPFPRISFRIQDRTTTQDQLQRLINTLIVDPDCVLDRFSSFGEVEVNITSDTSLELDIPSEGMTQIFNASEYPLLEYC